MLHNCLCCWGSSHQHFILCKLYINSFIVLLYKLRFAALRDACLWDPKCNFFALSTITFLQCCSTLHFLHHFPFSGISCWKPSNRARSTETKSCRHAMTKKTICLSLLIHCDVSLCEGLPGLFSSLQKSVIHIPIWCKNTCRLLEVRFLLYPVNQNLTSLKVFYCINISSVSILCLRIRTLTS